MTTLVTPNRIPYWSGLLCEETLVEISERMTGMLTDTFFSTVTANSYSETEEKYASIEVRASDRLTKPIETRTELDLSDGGTKDYFAIYWSTARWHMSVSTECKTLAEVHEKRSSPDRGKHDWVQFTFDPRQIFINHYAPGGNRLLWVLSVEDHTRWDLM